MDRKGLQRRAAGVNPGTGQRRSPLAANQFAVNWALGVYRPLAVRWHRLHGLRPQAGIPLSSTPPAGCRPTSLLY
jgi:hypothetical protein